MTETKISQRDGLIEAIKELSQSCTDNGFPGIAKKSSELLERLCDESFRITVVGEFNRGKSTLVNALLELDVIPTAARETTATINVIGYGEQTKITVVDSQAGRKEISPNKDAFKEYTSLQDVDPETIHHVEIECSAPFLKNKIFLVDTPGVNDISQQRLDVTYGYMPLSDATIFLLDARKPFTASEKSFLEDHILKNNIPSLFFLINKIDLIDASQIEIVVKDVAEKLKQTLKIENVTILPISSELAHKGVFKEDISSLKMSQFLAFKDKLFNFINEGDRNVSVMRGGQLHLRALFNTYLQEIDIERSQLQMTGDELRRQLAMLNSSKSELLNQFNEILKYIDTDAEALHAKIETALLSRYKELFDTFIITIDTTNGDLTEFAEKILPFQYNTYVKTWFDNNAQSIENFLKFTTSNSVSAFQKSFAKAPLLDFVNTKCAFEQKQQIGSFKIGGKDELQKTNTVATVAGGIVAGALAFVSGGALLPAIMPSLIGGSFLSGKFITPYFAKQILEDQKNELKQLLRSKMKTEFDNLIKMVDQFTSDYYVQLKEALQKEFDRVYADLSYDIQKKINDNSDRTGSSDKRLHELDSLMIEVTQMQSRTQDILLYKED